MKAIEKKFQYINVGSAFMTNEYKKWLYNEGYELDGTKVDSEGNIDVYIYKLKEGLNESE